MTWKDTPENRQAFIADAARMIAEAGGVGVLVEHACDAWMHVNDNLQVNPATLKRKELEQAYTRAMEAAWHLARLSFAVNGSLLDGGDARRYNASKGGKGKLAKNPEAAATAAAKNEAVKLWPEANRHGWTANKMWTALCDRGHEAKPDSVRKWMTKLRNTGTC